MSDIKLLIHKPVITEKSTALKEMSNRYVFRVDIRANKRQIKQAVEELFDVKVKDVRTTIYKGKKTVVLNKAGRFAGLRPNWKKAYVTLEEDNSIEIFDVV